jgi:hypothetical protein
MRNGGRPLNSIRRIRISSLLGFIFSGWFLATFLDDERIDQTFENFLDFFLRFSIILPFDPMESIKAGKGEDADEQRESGQ